MRHKRKGYGGTREDLELGLYRWTTLGVWRVKGKYTRRKHGLDSCGVKKGVDESVVPARRSPYEGERRFLCGQAYNLMGLKKYIFSY